jgi:hypothetical protein
MGMICELYEVTEQQIQEFMAAPAAAVKWLEAENAQEPEQFINSGRAADLDKAWHGIHFLLTGSPWGGEPPLCFLLGGGATLGDEDFGYGPARVLQLQEVVAFDDVLSEISIEEFRSRFNPTLMQKNDIYPDIWDRKPEDDDTLGYLCEYFETLKSFVHTAREKNAGLLIFLS